MSWLKKLFGAGESADASSAPGGDVPEEEYKGFVIRATLMAAGSEFQLAGRIEKDVAGERKQYDFVRADRFSSKADAQSSTLAKGRQIIDEQGEGMFAQTWPVKPN